MAVGKSAVGRNLARRLKRRFVDLDRLIEKTEGKKVREIFAEKGEAYFRQLEKQALAQVLRENRQVIATGGGIVMEDENLDLLQERATLIALTASVDTLLSRIGNGTKRPLLRTSDRRQRIQDLLVQRENRYARAHFTVNTDNLSMAQVVEQIVVWLDSENKLRCNA